MAIKESKEVKVTAIKPLNGKDGKTVPVGGTMMVSEITKAKLLKAKAIENIKE